MKLVRYNRAMNGRNEGDKSVISARHAQLLAADGIVTIIDHPAFPHKGATEFAGLPAPIPPPAVERRKR